MFFRLVKQLAEKEGVTEQLKAENQMLWVARMNNIRNRDCKYRVGLHLISAAAKWDNLLLGGVFIA